MRVFVYNALVLYAVRSGASHTQQTAGKENEKKKPTGVKGTGLWCRAEGGIDRFQNEYSPSDDADLTRKIAVRGNVRTARRFVNKKYVRRTRW